MKNWLDCLRSRMQPNATVEHGFVHSMAVIMAARAQREAKSSIGTLRRNGFSTARQCSYGDYRITRLLASPRASGTGGFSL
jgi:hypothetical protein